VRDVWKPATLVAVAFVEKRRQRVEGVGRDLLECVGSHGVLR
jgi:hypothetical protein